MKIDKKLLSAGVALALPIAFQNLLVSCANIVDTAMVINLGNSATSAVGVAGRYSFLLNVMTFGICSGCSALISQYWGARQNIKIKYSYGTALMLCAALGVLFTLFLALFPTLGMKVFTDEPEVISAGAEYLRIYAYSAIFNVFTQVTCAALRATERVYIPLIASGAGVAANLVLNYMLIYGKFGAPALGIAGAAAATFCSTILQAVIVLLAVIFGKTAISGRVGELFAFDRAFLKKYLQISLPVLFNETMWAIGTNIYVMVLARQGTENHSGYTVYETAQQLFFVFFVGICHACAILVGKSVGAGKHEEAYTIAKKFLILTPLAGAVIGALLILVRDPLLSLLPIETEGAREVASQLLLFFGFWLGIRNIPYTSICGIFRAGGDTKTGFFLDIGGLFLCGIPVVIILGLFVKIPFIPLVMCMYFAEDIPKGILCIRHFLSRKWIRQITTDEQ